MDPLTFGSGFFIKKSGDFDHQVKAGFYVKSVTVSGPKQTLFERQPVNWMGKVRQCGTARGGCNSPAPKVSVDGIAHG